MSSQQRIDASRANGALSRGPKSPQGKARSSRNATRHGLLAKSAVLHNESPEEFQALLQAFIARLNPASLVEFGLVKQMADAHWRLRRARAFEERILEQSSASQPDGDALRDSTISQKLGVLSRHEACIHLVQHRALSLLVHLRNRGLPIEPNSPLVSTLEPNQRTQGTRATQGAR